MKPSGRLCLRLIFTVCGPAVLAQSGQEQRVRIEHAMAASDGMPVFGFGRADGAVPLIRESRTFFLGFWEQAIVTPQTHNELGRYVERLLRP